MYVWLWDKTTETIENENLIDEMLPKSMFFSVIF